MFLLVGHLSNRLNRYVYFSSITQPRSISSSIIFLLFKIVQIHILIRYLWNSNILLSLSARKRETINYFKNPNWTRSRIIQRKRARSIYSSIIFLLLTIVRIRKSFLIRINFASKSFEYSNSREIKNYFKYIFTFLVLSRDSSSGSIFEGTIELTHRDQSA